MSLLSPSLLLLTLLLVLLCLLGDYLVLSVIPNDSSNKSLVLLRCFVDNGVHGIVGFLSWVIVVLGNNNNNNDVILRLTPRFGFDYRLLEVVACGILASAIDVDHFLEAGAFDINKALHLPHRPLLHCTTIPLVIFPATVLANHLFHYPRVERAGLVILVAFLSHHLRDAWRRGLWLSPMTENLPVSYWGYVLGVAVLPNLVRVYAGWRTLDPSVVSEGPETMLLLTV